MRFEVRTRVTSDSETKTKLHSMLKCLVDDTLDIYFQVMKHKISNAGHGYGSKASRNSCKAITITFAMNKNDGRGHGCARVSVIIDSNL